MSKEIKLLTDAQLAWRRYNGIGIGLPIIASLNFGDVGLLIVDILILYYLWHNRTKAWYKDNMGSALLTLICISIAILLLNADHTIQGVCVLLFGFFTDLLASPDPEN